MVKIVYDDITLTANAGGTGTTGTSYGTHKNLFIDQILVHPDNSTTSTIPLDDWDLSITEEADDDSTLTRTIYTNTAMNNLTVNTAVIRSGVVDLATAAVSDSHAKVFLKNRLALSGANMGTSTTAYVRIFYEQL